jgi:hypothetical protein
VLDCPEAISDLRRIFQEVLVHIGFHPCDLKRCRIIALDPCHLERLLNIPRTRSSGLDRGDVITASPSESEAVILLPGGCQFRGSFSGRAMHQQRPVRFQYHHRITGPR